MQVNGSGREGVARGSATAELVLRWAPSLLFACATWAVFHDDGWLAWLVTIAGAYVGRAAGDLATAGSHRVESGPPRG